MGNLKEKISGPGVSPGGMVTGQIDACISPSSGMVVTIPDEGLSPKRRIFKVFFKFTYFALGSLIP